MKTFSFLLLTCISFMTYAQSPNTGLIVKTVNGTLEGGAENNIRTFKGIPFAQPPVGDLVKNQERYRLLESLDHL